MAAHFPKRISELACNDSDIETPEKFNRNAKNNGLYPKRIADLDIPEYDSDDDKNDRLNCAILNDSFVLSPSKDIPSTPVSTKECPISVKKSKLTEENNKNEIIQDNKKSDDSGFLTRISTMKVRSPDTVIEKHQPVKNTRDKNLLRRSRSQLFPPKENDPPQYDSKLSAATPKIFQNRLEEQLKKEEDLPRTNCPKILPKSNIENNNETPFKKNDQQIFITPSTRPFPAKLTNSSLSTCEREQNQGRKVLFTTPRQFPLSNLSTPIDSKHNMQLPPSHRKLSPIMEPLQEKPKENILTINKIDYEIEKKIGCGGSSSVFLAKGRKSGKECAIKLVNLDADQSVVEGYLNETKLLAKLQGNINVVALYDYCHIPAKNTLYMVMEKGDSDLHKILQGYTTHIPLYALVNYWYQMLQAVNYIHQNGVIHSDLKPANFLMINGRLKLIDFGIASNIAIDSTSIIKFSQAGTFNYISPEALIDTSSGDSPSNAQPRIRISTKSDVWSLGCILYLLLYKKTPFSHIKVLHQKMMTLTNPKTVIDYPVLPSFYPPILVEMLKRCLVYNPKERSSVADLLKYPFDMLISI